MSRTYLDEAARVVDFLQAMNLELTEALVANGEAEDEQVFAYDLAHLSAGAQAASVMVEYGHHGPMEEQLALVFIADVAREACAKLLGREALLPRSTASSSSIRDFLSEFLQPKVLAALAQAPGPNHLEEHYELVQESFHRFATERIEPYASEVHRKNLDVPEDIIAGLGELGAFGLSIPESYGGSAQHTPDDFMAMVIATEELSRASLSIGGSLITRPEILARALLRGGTEAQKQRWLPLLADGSVMNAVAVTEPDFGSDVAHLRTTASKSPHGDGWLINGVKTWCTFAGRADVLMLLARTDPDRSLAHRGLSLFMVPKERYYGEAFTIDQRGGGRLEARAIDTIGYRGMHSYEIAFDNFFVDDDALIGGESGLGRGFYFQMEGFENGRIQTAARAVGLMQRAYEEALSYARHRNVFGQAVLDYQLTSAKLGRMAAIIQASRQFSYHVAGLMGSGKGALEASMIKAYVCRAAEWVTREAMQIHGGMGYAEEFTVSRLFVDARVLSIFEGADETLALKVIARRLLDQATKGREIGEALPERGQ
jgi:(2S)-methylsuccinyl-CoA dehydrogenase